jgi:hypothetical protein
MDGVGAVAELVVEGDLVEGSEGQEGEGGERRAGRQGGEAGGRRGRKESQQEVRLHPEA